MTVSKVIRQDLYEVQDIVTNKKYNVHIDRMRKLKLSSRITSEKLLEIAGIDHLEYIVEKILDHRKKGKGKNDYEFYVKWEGFSDEENSWEPYSNLKEVVALSDYLVEHPELKLSAK